MCIYIHAHIGTRTPIQTTAEILRAQKGWLLLCPARHTPALLPSDTEGSLGSSQWAIKECNCKPRSGGRFPQGCPSNSQLRKCSSACERNNMRSRLRQGALHWVTWARLMTTALSPASQHQLWCQSVNSSLSQPCSSLHVSERREGRKDGLSCSLLKCSIRAWALMYL